MRHSRSDVSFFKQFQPPLSLGVVHILDFHPGTGALAAHVPAPFPLGHDTLQIYFAATLEQQLAFAVDVIEIQNARRSPVLRLRYNLWQAANMFAGSSRAAAGGGAHALLWNQ